jgi:hypothetical protein
MAQVIRFSRALSQKDFFPILFGFTNSLKHVSSKTRTREFTRTPVIQLIPSDGH